MTSPRSFSLEGPAYQVHSEGPACQVRCITLDYPFHFGGHDERAPPPFARRVLRTNLTQVPCRCSATRFKFCHSGTENPHWWKRRQGLQVRCIFLVKLGVTFVRQTAQRLQRICARID